MLLFWDRFSVSKPLSQIQRRTLLFLQQASYTPSFGGLGLKLTYVLVELGDKGFLSLPVSILVCAKDSPSSFNQCSPPGADLAWVDLEPANYLCCGLLTFECLKGYLSLKGGAVLLATLLHLLLLRAYFVILGAGTDLSYLSEILGPSQGTGTVAALATLQGITNGTVTFLGQTVTGLDFSGDNDLDGVASTLQTALRATSATSLDNVEVAYDGSAFVVTIPLDSSGVATSVSAAFTGSESDELGLDTATIVDGVDIITSGSVTLNGATASGLDFSAVTDYDGVAVVVQTGLRGTSETDLDEVEAAYVDGAFVITVPLDEDGNPVIVTGAVTGDTADELGLDTVSTVQGSVTNQDNLALVERLTVAPNDITITVPQP